MKAQGRSDIHHLGVVLVPPPPEKHTHGHVQQIDAPKYAHAHMNTE